MNDQLAVSTPTFPSGLFDALPEAIRVYIRYLKAIIRQQQAYAQQTQEQIQKLPTRVHALEAHLSKNSSNSSKFPNSGGLNRTRKDLRTKSRRNPWGQQGQTGAGAAPISNPAVHVSQNGTFGTGFDTDAIGNKPSDVDTRSTGYHP